MKLFLHTRFKKDYRKLRANKKARWKERRDLFLKDPFDLVLNNHPLHGSYAGFRSINITGDLRALYRSINGDTHSNLYD